MSTGKWIYMDYIGANNFNIILLADALDMQSVEPAGTYYYVSNLVRGLMDEGVAVTTLHYKPGLKWSTNDVVIPMINNRSLSPIQLTLRSTAILRKLHNLNAHALHLPMWGASYSPILLLKYISSFKIIATVHDLGNIIYPQFYKYGYLERIGLLQCFRMLGRMVDAIIAVSRNTAEDLVKLAKVPRWRLHVVYEGIDEIFKPLNKESCRKIVHKLYGIDQDHVLYVGTMHPRKNLERLITAYALAIRKGLKHKLVLAGHGGDDEPKVRQMIRKLNLDHCVQIVGHQPYECLPYLYNASDIFVYPSLYEGFGRPVLEAMACGVPVVASNASCIPEIVGDAGILVNPCDIEEISQALVGLVENSDLRSELSAKGVQRARRFKWADTIQETLEVYNKCLK